MPAPSRLKIQTDAVQRCTKEEAYLVEAYKAADEKIEDAQKAPETLEGNKAANVYQIEQDRRDTVNVYVGANGRPGIFQRIEGHLEKLNDEIEKVGEREVDETMEKELKLAKDVVERAEALIKGGEKLKVEKK